MPPNPKVLQIIRTKFRNIYLLQRRIPCRIKFADIVEIIKLSVIKIYENLLTGFQIWGFNAEGVQDFAGEKFYCPACPCWWEPARFQIREKTLEFSTVLSTLSPYLKTAQ